MEGFLLLSVATSFIVGFWGAKQRRRLGSIEVKLRKVQDIELYCRNLREDAEEKQRSIEQISQEKSLETDDYIRAEREKLELHKNNSLKDLEETLQSKKVAENKELHEYEARRDEMLAEIKNIEETTPLYSDHYLLVNSGVYERIYSYQDDSLWQQKLDKIIKDQKSMLRNWPGDRYFLLRFGTTAGDEPQKVLTAAYSTGRINLQKADFYGDAEALKQGTTYQQNLVKLMLKAFNIEVQSQINGCTFRNFEIRKQRIEKAFLSINKTGVDYKVRISHRYLLNRLDELILRYEWFQHKESVKEEQRKINQQIKEEREAMNLFEKQKKEAEEKEIIYADAIMQAEESLREATDDEYSTIEKKLADLQQKLDSLVEKREYISQAMLTKSGHVYIISNLGSFGDGIYKIGMTRRIDPMERVRELGDASVPFPFDVHALISTSNAPALERGLHKYFDHKRVNLENSRKEFFYVSLEEIQQALAQQKDELGLTASMQLTLAAEADQWRNSQARQKYLKAQQDIQ